MEHTFVHEPLHMPSGGKYQTCALISSMVARSSGFTTSILLTRSLTSADRLSGRAGYFPLQEQALYYDNMFAILQNTEVDCLLAGCP